MEKKVELIALIIFLILICSSFLSIFFSDNIGTNQINNTLIDTNDVNYTFVHIDYVSPPQKLVLNETYNSPLYPGIIIKLLKVDTNNNKCLIKNVGTSLSEAVWIRGFGDLSDKTTRKKVIKDMNDTQWFNEGDPIFPYIYGNIGVIIKKILSNEIYFTIGGGKTISGKAAEKYFEGVQKDVDNNNLSSSIKIMLQESYQFELYPWIQIKPLKIDSKNERCLINYEGPTDSNLVNPQWFKKGSILFPSILNESPFVILDINDDFIQIDYSRNH